MLRLPNRIDVGLGSAVLTQQAPSSALVVGRSRVQHPRHGSANKRLGDKLVCNSDPRGRTKWYGTYTEEQYQAQRQSEERARWAASVRTLTGRQDQASWSLEASPLLDPPALLAGVTVVLLSPRKPVTVGTVARACGSFECEDLRIVMPRQESYITRHAKSASKGAQYILYRAGHYDSIEEATEDCDVRIAFTRWSQSSGPHVCKVDISGLTSHAAVRRVLEAPLEPGDLEPGDDPSVVPIVPGAVAASAASVRPPRVALVFGREELGLSDGEVDGCEVVCSVPIGRLQESLSLSHAVSIALCALYQARLQHLTATKPTTFTPTAPAGPVDRHYVQERLRWLVANEGS